MSDTSLLWQLTAMNIHVCKELSKHEVRKHLRQLHYSRLKRKTACAWLASRDKLSRSVCTIIAGIRCASADPCTCVSISIGKEASVAVLLKIKRKLMNIDCHLLKSCTTMTAQWGLVSFWKSALYMYIQMLCL